MLGIGLSLPAYHHFKKSSEINKVLGSSAHISIVSIESEEDAIAFSKDFSEVPIIHHLSNVAPADIDGPDLSRMHKLNEISKLLDAKWCLEDIGAWTICGFPAPYFIATILDQEWLDLLVERIQLINQVTSTPFLLEIPSFSFIAGDMTLPDFFNQLTNRLGNDIVMDISHIFSYAIATEADPLNVLKALNLDKVREIHIAGGRVNKKYSYRYIDSHSDPILPEVYDLLDFSLQHCNNLEAVTFEISEYQSDELILSDFEKLKEFVY